MVEQQTFVFSQTWRLEVQDRGVAGWVSRGPSPWLINDGLFLPPRGHPSVTVCDFISSCYKDTGVIWG